MTSSLNERGLKGVVTITPTTNVTHHLCNSDSETTRKIEAGGNKKAWSLSTDTHTVYTHPKAETLQAEEGLTWRCGRCEL